MAICVLNCNMSGELVKFDKDRALDLIRQGASVNDVGDEFGIHGYQVYWQLTKTDELRVQYRDALISKGARFADEVVGIADNPWIAAEDKRIMVDARKWAAGKFFQQAFGDKGVSSDLNVNIDGKGEARAVEIRVVNVAPKPVKDEKLADKGE